MNMLKEDLFQNDSAALYYLSDLEAIYLELKGSVDTADYKEVYNQLLKFIISKDIKAVIADQTKSKGSSMEARAWLIVKWLPELKKQVGNKKILIAGVSEAKIGMKKFIGQYLEQTFKKVTPFPIESFESVDDAIRWIKAHQNL
ncbi:MAG: hypothetical protein SFU27_03010 [Thermonemataceae bacterium]|nr:hypothetical protein [Thermonemataceae bacterium]